MKFSAVIRTYFSQHGFMQTYPNLKFEKFKEQTRGGYSVRADYRILFRNIELCELISGIASKS